MVALWGATVTAVACVVSVFCCRGLYGWVGASVAVCAGAGSVLPAGAPMVWVRYWRLSMPHRPLLPCVLGSALFSRVLLWDRRDLGAVSPQRVAFRLIRYAPMDAQCRLEGPRICLRRLTRPAGSPMSPRTPRLCPVRVLGVGPGALFGVGSWAARVVVGCFCRWPGPTPLLRFVRKVLDVYPSYDIY